MNTARWVIVFCIGGAAALACSSSSSSFPPAATDPPNYYDAAASPPTTSEVAYYEGCDPTEITDAAIGNCACFVSDGGEDSSVDASHAVTFTLPCGLDYGICSGLTNDLRFCTTDHQGVFFPGCPTANSFGGPDGSIPMCEAGTKSVLLP